jgi:nucleoside-diphosphate-sugar epimerase
MAIHTITGASGLLGAHLVFHLLQRGKKVRVIHRASSKLGSLEKILGYYHPNPQELLQQIELKEADLLDLPALEKALEGTTYLYHCAAIVSFAPKDKQRLLDENTDTTANVVNVALALGIQKMVHVSSVAALGRKENEKHFDESSQWVESKRNSAYAKSKYLAELEVWRGQEEGLPTAIVNPSIIIGPGPWQSGSAGLFYKIAQGFKFYTTGVNAYVDARDVAEVMERLMESPIEGERFVVAAENWSYQNFFSEVAQALGVPAPSIAVKPWLSAIAWRVEAIKAFFTDKNPLITKETAMAALSENYYQNQKVKEALGFSFKPLKESIQEIATFYRKDFPA